MIIKEIEIRSYKSFGNNPQIIKLDTNGGELVLLVGTNGSGKSLVLSTEIDIEIDTATLSEEDRMIFLETIEFTGMNKFIENNDVYMQKKKYCEENKLNHFFSSDVENIKHKIKEVYEIKNNIR